MSCDREEQTEPYNEVKKVIKDQDYGEGEEDVRISSVKVEFLQRNGMVGWYSLIKRRERTGIYRTYTLDVSGRDESVEGG